MTAESHVKVWRDDATYPGMVRFSGCFTDHDLMRIELSDLDRAVLAEAFDCPADLLQNLEILFRRLAERQTARTV